MTETTTDTTKTTRTPADEMRDAAQLLRQAAEGTTSTEGGWGGFVNEDTGHAFIFGGPLDPAGYRTGIVFEFKDEMDCENCARPSGADVLWMSVATPALAEPLAQWLETEAHMIEQQGLSPEGHSFDALKVARAINGEPATT